MDYSYVAYTVDRGLIRGKLSATSEEAAVNLLNYGGYQVISLKPITSFLNLGRLAILFSQVKPREVIMFSRQLALLLESGTDIVSSIELLQSQATNKTLKNILGEVASDIRGGSSVSTALSKHPRTFSRIYHRALAAGEQAGNLEIVLRQMADYLERGVDTEKKVKNALTYPVIVVIVAILVVGILVTFVLPSFTSMYASFSVDLPLPTKILVALGDWAGSYGVYFLIGLIVAIGAGFAYIKTPAGKSHLDRLVLRLPVVGRIYLLNELSRCCRTMALLFKVGLPLPEIMKMAIHGSNNKVMIEALTEVQQELIRGEGLSGPMGKRAIFLPLMVQMVRVGEETGNLDNTLATVAQSYEVEADDRTGSAVALIQPAITIAIGLVVAFIAMSLVSTMYSVFGGVGL